MSDHWSQVEELYARLSELPARDRQRLLDLQRPAAPEVVAEVESLLAAEPPSEQFLSTPWLSGGSPIDPMPELTGRQIGAFRLVESIGAGGAGVVYRAEREEAGFAQRVAIKVVTAARWHSGSLKRFRAERQHLAALHHPHIVTLLDGGITEDGLAYLVMEYVDGTPITRYCRERSLGLDERLRLVQQVCGAVQYAHRHSIVHRDLKPANVLVTAEGVPKILDFGIARLVTEPGGTHTTAGPLQALTPNYASPEQVRGLPPTTADDVYALGIVLYELVSGHTPYDVAGMPLDEMLRVISDRPAPRPSTVIDPAEQPSPRSEVAGNLDAIVLKAIDKDPARRYGSAQELADDIGRHLHGEVVVAREPSLAYVLGTLARRHRTVVAAALVSVLAVLSALGVSLIQTRRALAERDRADRRFGEVRRLANTLIFDIHDAVQPLPGSTPVRQRIVSEALAYLEGLAGEADTDDLRIELGRAYQRIGTVQGNPTTANLGDREGAIASYRKAIAILSPAAARSETAALEQTQVQFLLVAVLNSVGRPADAAIAAREAEVTVSRLLVTRPDHDEARRQLATALFWQATLAETGAGPGQSIELWQRSGNVFDALLAEKPDDPNRQRNVALVAKYLGEQYRQVGDLDRALDQHRRARDIDEQRVARDPGNRQAQMDLALDWSSVGGILEEKGALPEAVAGLEASLDLRERLAAADPKDDYLRGRLAHAHATLAVAYDKMARTPDALRHLREAVSLGESRPLSDVQTRLDRGRHLVNLAAIERRAGLLMESCDHFSRAARLEMDEISLSGSAERARQAVVEEISTGLDACGTPSRAR